MRREETQVRQRVAKIMGEEADRGVVADITVAPKNIQTGRHTVVRARPLPENIENLEKRN